jgi:hypothetical protein
MAYIISTPALAGVFLLGRRFDFEFLIDLSPFPHETSVNLIFPLPEEWVGW